MPDRKRSTVSQAGGSFYRKGLKAAVAVGAVAAAASLLEAAVLPGLAIGAAAAIAPSLLSRRSRRRPGASPTVRSNVTRTDIRPRRAAERAMS